MYKWIEIKTSGDVDKIVTEIPSEYSPQDVAAKLSLGLSEAVKAILIEDPYVDKDYRSTFYRYYAKKGRQYNPNCIRLHFFDKDVSFDEEHLDFIYPEAPLEERLSYHYFGYMVLRPTGISTIGRSVVSPGVRRDGDRENPWFAIVALHKVHLLGRKLKVAGFPSMDQHTDISVCAHVACWSILRHYSERYSLYREHLTHDVTLMAQQYNPGGLIPSFGLSSSNAERIFQEAGTFPLIIPRDDRDPDKFYQQLTAYLESGFPLFAMLPNHNGGHAVAVIGYERKTPGTQALPCPRHVWTEIKALLVVDDNYLPYQSVPVESGGLPYSTDLIEGFIVALPEGIHYSAEHVGILLGKLLPSLPVFGLPSPDQLILRFFITTAAGLRIFIRKNVSEFDTGLLKLLMEMSFAQFVWVAEFATPEQWAASRISGRAIIDATASAHEPNPLWLIHSSGRAFFCDRKNADMSAFFNTIHLTSIAGTFTRMDQNLPPTQHR